MSYDHCTLEVEKVLGRELSNSEKREVTERVTNIIKKLEAKPLTESLDVAVMKALKEDSAKIELAAVIEKRNTAFNEVAKLKLADRLLNSDDPGEELKAILLESLSARKGAKNSLANTVRSLQHEYVMGLRADLEKAGLIKIARDPATFDDIFLAMAELNQKVPDQAKLSAMIPEVVEVAKILNKYTELARIHANKAGAWIGKEAGRVIRRTHDHLKIAKAAGVEVPMSERKTHFKAWFDFMTERLDFDRTFTDVLPENYESVMYSIYNQLSQGEHFKLPNDGPSTPGLKGVGNVGKKLSHERVFHFKDANAELEYHRKFGSSEGMVDTVMNGLMQMARDTAIMRKLGPNAFSNLEDVVKTTSRKLSDSGHPEKASQLTDQLKDFNRKYKSAFDGSGAVSNDAAEWNRLVRNIFASADLARAVLSAPTDFAYAAATARYVDGRDTASFFNGMTDVISEMKERFGRGSTAEEMQLASELGILIDAVMNPAASLDPDFNARGTTSNILQSVFKFQGLTWWQDSVRLGAATAHAHRMANFAGMSFEKLPAGTKSILEQFGMGEVEWNVIRKAEVFTDARGRKLLTAGAIDNLPGKAIDALPEMASRLEQIAKKEGLSDETRTKLIESARDRARTDLKDKYRTMFSEIASMATSEPGIVERGLMLQGTEGGTLGGELFRHTMMYKSFMVSVLRKHLGREFHGYRVNRLSTPEALRLLFTGKGEGGAQALATMIPVAIALGYVSRSLKDIAAGKKPRVPTDLESFKNIFLASAAQSGAMGIYGDFLFGEAKNRYGEDFILTALGPTARRFSQVANILKSPDPKNPKKMDKAAQVTNFALQNAPGLGPAYNMFYTKWAFDYLIVHRMQEMMNPGYLKRMETNLKNSKGQEYIHSPSKYFGR